MEVEGVLNLDKEKMKLIYVLDRPEHLDNMGDDVLFIVFDSIGVAVANFGKEKVISALAGRGVHAPFEFPEEVVKVEPEAVPGYQ